MTDSADAVVIGGGSTGASILFHLAEAGLRRSVLLESSTFASGPTGRSPAVLRQHYGSRVLVRMAKYSLSIFERWQDEFGTACGLVQNGFFGGAGERNADNLRRIVSLQADEGVRVEIVAPDELRKVFQGIELDDLVVAMHEPDAGYCDPYLAVAGMIARARALGATAKQGVPVRRILVRNGAVAGVATPTGEIASPVVVLAAGPWSKALAEPAGATLPIVNTRHSLWGFGQKSIQTRVGAVFADYVNGFYVRPDSGGTCLVGSLRHRDGTEVRDPDRFDQGVGFDETGGIAQRFVRRFPLWTESEVRSGWSSLFDETPDGTPVLGEAGGIRGLFVAAGMSGHGFKLCPAVGRWIADRVMGRPLLWPESELGMERFGRAGAPALAYVYD